MNLNLLLFMIEIGVILGVIGGIFGIFFRDCMKVKNMIFNRWYLILKGWVERKDESVIMSLLSWIAYPLGYCIYCSTTWITIFLDLIYLSNVDVFPKWQGIVMIIVSSLGLQHLVVSIACRYLISNHPDLSKTI